MSNLELEKQNKTPGYIAAEELTRSWKSENDYYFYLLLLLKKAQYSYLPLLLTRESPALLSASPGKERKSSTAICLSW